MLDRSTNFIDLASYTCAQRRATLAHGPLIKSRDVAGGGSHVIDVEGADADQPTIITHRDGEIITAIEVKCACGASTIISLEY